MKEKARNRGAYIKYICFVLIPCFCLMGFMTFRAISSQPMHTVQTYCTACINQDWGSVYRSLSTCMSDNMVDGRELFIEAMSRQQDTPFSHVSSFQIEEKSEAVEKASPMLTKEFAVHYTTSGSSAVQTQTVRVIKQKSGGWLVAPDSAIEYAFQNRK